MTNIFKKSAIAILFSLFSAAHAADNSSIWLTKRAGWTDALEREYSQFVQAIGLSSCRRVDECLKSVANPYRASNPPRVNFRSDCADWPYTLRGYFSWKKNLPFTYATQADPIGGGRDNRYSVNGNKITKRRLISEKNNAPRVLSVLVDEVSTAMFRVPPDTDSTGESFPDFYPVALEPGSIRPGTVYYDPSGHVIVVYEIEKNGIIRYIDAHPDNSVTRGLFGEKFGRSRAAHGAGFKNFRPIQLVGANKDQDQNLIGKHIVGAKNADLPNYSLEEYYGNSSDPKTKGAFVLNGRVYKFHEYVRNKMAGGNLKYNVVNELKGMLGALCNDFRDRVFSVDEAIHNRVNSSSHPDMLPGNIYGTNDNTWESYSTPSRDARLKTSALEMRKTIEELVNRYHAHDPQVEYSGRNLAADLLQAYSEESLKCQIQYTNSAGQKVTLPYKTLLKRLFALSFDPYNCAELRWGANQDANEFKTCTDDSYKLKWYSAEQRLRNQIDRDYNAVMNFRLNELASKAKGSGVDVAPEVDLETYLNKMNSSGNL